MKAKIYVTLKQSVLDPQGKTVQRALEQMNYKNVDSVRIGRFLEVELNCDDEAKAAAQIEEMSKKLFVNPNIEQFRYELEK
ncbi:phosphoribosylformylglycinamidine synthase subunit PurS [bacterium]|jgi:phosphoribosylformylglycinamidine synthase|nr:phosphoribosylformylglycinamidine synthase subunit PurS [bacterium]MBR4465519.1 phosphoribosylformylglycinamidine synthase subunit PurS [bacterium]MBR4820420.1 phosphoribosylformylglycinamidine synthase subunit PurS [bacterium]